MNDEEFREFYDRYYEFSIRIANRIVKSRSTAEDIAQEVFCYFYRIMDKLDNSDEKKLRALVTLEATNKARDYLRKSYVKREMTIEEDVAALQHKKMESAEAILLGMEQSKYMRLVFEKLRNKNPMNYDIFLKVKILDISPDEVAKEYGITRNNVNNRILRTKLWLKEELSRMYDE